VFVVLPRLVLILRLWRVPFLLASLSLVRESRRAGALLAVNLWFERGGYGFLGRGSRMIAALGVDRGGLFVGEGRSLLRWVVIDLMNFDLRNLSEF
jgi:hypothetical protein